MPDETLKDPAFEVTLSCSNCGDEWDEQYRSRTVVDGRRDGVHVCPKDAEFGDAYREQCPTCELYKTVTDDERQPLDDHADSDGDDE